VPSRPDDLVARLRAAARAAATNAYAPYSGFRVGAACVTGSGAIHAGANVENASYGLAMCAERNAVFRAVAAGEREIRALIVYTPTPVPTTPCGACRQVLCEFGDRITVICCCDGDGVLEFTSDGLLPERFRLKSDTSSE
jgi:cytidine deaminase